MAAFRKFEDPEIRVLSALGNGVMLGRELMSRSGIYRTDEFITVVRPLVRDDIIQVKGLLDPDQISLAAFSIRSSDRDFVESTIRQSL